MSPLLNDVRIVMTYVLTISNIKVFNKIYFFLFSKYEKVEYADYGDVNIKTCTKSIKSKKGLSHLILTHYSHNSFEEK